MKVPNIKFKENLPSANDADTFGQTARHTDMTKPIGAFRDYANVFHNEYI
jgi:hypothetical protein